MIIIIIYFDLSHVMTVLSSQNLEMLYREHHSWIYTWLYRRLGNSADAADLAQDTFIRVITRKSLLEIEQPRAYLTTVAKSLMLNWFNRRNIEQAYLEVLANQPEFEHPSPEQRYLIVETLIEVIQLLDALPDQIRDVFLHAQLENMNYQQIADQFNLSLSTVKRHIKKAYIHCLTAMLDTDFSC